MARTQFKQLDTENKTTWYDRNCAINTTLRRAHTQTQIMNRFNLTQGVQADFLKLKT